MIADIDVQLLVQPEIRSNPSADVFHFQRGCVPLTKESEFPKKILERKDEQGRHEVWPAPRVRLAVSLSQVCPAGISRCCTRVVENDKERCTVTRVTVTTQRHFLSLQVRLHSLNSRLTLLPSHPMPPPLLHPTAHTSQSRLHVGI
jgi:hypothetical protein